MQLFGRKKSQPICGVRNPRAGDGCTHVMISIIDHRCKPGMTKLAASRQLGRVLPYRNTASLLSSRYLISSACSYLHSVHFGTVISFVSFFFPFFRTILAMLYLGTSNNAIHAHRWCAPSQSTQPVPRSCFNVNNDKNPHP